VVDTTIDPKLLTGKSVQFAVNDSMKEKHMAASNNRFALVDILGKTLTVYEKRKPLATYHFVDGKVPSAEDIEWARTEEYKDRA